jgi:hypothetical protein
MTSGASRPLMAVEDVSPAPRAGATIYAFPGDAQPNGLLVRPEPLAEESWPGYYLRLSNANGLKGLRPLGDAIMRIGSEVAPDGLFNPDSWPRHFSPWPSPFHDYRRRESLLGCEFVRLSQICPRCIEEDEIQHTRATWDHPGSSRCHVHDIGLVSQCDSCGQPIDYKRRKLMECDCGRAFASMGVPSTQVPHALFPINDAVKMRRGLQALIKTTGQPLTVVLDWIGWANQDAYRVDQICRFRRQALNVLVLASRTVTHSASKLGGASATAAMVGMGLLHPFKVKELPYKLIAAKELLSAIQYVKSLAVAKKSSGRKVIYLDEALSMRWKNRGTVLGLLLASAHRGELELFDLKPSVPSLAGLCMTKKAFHHWLWTSVKGVRHL